MTQANADKQAGEAAARSEAAVQTAREIAQKKWKEAKARKVESSLKADKIVPAEIAKQEAVLQADAVAERLPARQRRGRRLCWLRHRLKPRLSR